MLYPQSLTLSELIRLSKALAEIRAADSLLSDVIVSVDFEESTGLGKAEIELKKAAERKLNVALFHLKKLDG